MNKNKLFLTFLLLTVIIPFSCVEEEEPLWNVSVNFSINLLNYPGLLNGGVPLEYRGVGFRGNGIIIFPVGYGEATEFRAYDATCIRDSVAVKVDENNVTATCPKCKTVYNLLTGYAANENFHLQQYAARRDGANRLYITNK
jgi:hypothetical protein